MPALSVLISAIGTLIAQFLFKNKGAVVAGGAAIGVATLLRKFFGSWLNLWHFITDGVSGLFESSASIIASFQTRLDAIDLDPWIGYVGFANYCLPLQEFLLLSVATFGILGTIRAARWVKSFIPTVGD